MCPPSVDLNNRFALTRVDETEARGGWGEGGAREEYGAGYAVKEGWACNGGRLRQEYHQRHLNASTFRTKIFLELLLAIDATGAIDALAGVRADRGHACRRGCQATPLRWSGGA